MEDVRVRKLDDEVVLLLKGRAKREGMSVEAILRKLITEDAKRPKREMMAELREHQRAVREAYGELPDSTTIIIEERERIGCLFWMQALRPNGSSPKPTAQPQTSCRSPPLGSPRRPLSTMRSRGPCRA